MGPMKSMWYQGGETTGTGLSSGVDDSTSSGFFGKHHTCLHEHCTVDIRNPIICC